MTSIQLLLTLATVVALAAGQVLFKLAARGFAQFGWSVGAVLGNIHLWLALVVYGGATLVWIYVLTMVPLKLAYPFVALSFVVVPLLAHSLLHEPLHWQQMAGAAIIVLGVWVSSLGAAL